jgi:hypothetical protein
VCIKAHSGMIFCHVVSKRLILQFVAAITAGNQKCPGAAPSFKRRLMRNRVVVVEVEGQGRGEER